MQNNKFCYSFNSQAKIVNTIRLQKDYMNGGFLPKPTGCLYENPDNIILKENETLTIIDENTPAEKWEVIPHYVNMKLYHKVDKSEKIIEEIGQSPADFPDYTEIPVPDNKYSGYYNYSEQTRNWVFDLLKYKTDKLDALSAAGVVSNYKILPRHKRDNIYAGSPADDDYPSYLKGEAGKQSIARLNAIYQNISLTAKTAIMSVEVDTPEAVDLIIDNIKFPTEEEILVQIQG